MALPHNNALFASVIFNQLSIQKRFDDVFAFEAFFQRGMTA